MTAQLDEQAAEFIRLVIKQEKMREVRFVEMSHPMAMVRVGGRQSDERMPLTVRPMTVPYYGDRADASAALAKKIAVDPVFASAWDSGCDRLDIIVGVQRLFEFSNGQLTAYVAVARKPLVA
jgi:hypothetical protein